MSDLPQAEWDGLRTPDSSPFVEWTWLDCLEKTGCVGSNAGWLPRHITVYRGDSLVAAAPAYVKASSEGEFVFDWSWAELADRLAVPYYPKLVIAVPFTPATGTRVLTRAGEDRDELVALVAHAARKWANQSGICGIHVLFPREPEVQTWVNSGFMHRTGFQFQWHSQGEHSFADFLGRFNSKRRHQIRRELSEVERHISIATLKPNEHTRDIAHRMFAFYKSTVDKHYYGNQYLNRAFFEALVERFRDKLAWVVARNSSNDIIAGAFNIRGTDTLYGRYWGVEEGVNIPFLHFAVCYYEGVRHAIAEGLVRFEPGAGGEHKRARGFLPTTTHSAHWLADPAMTRVLSAHLETERRRVQALVDSEEHSENTPS